MQILKGEDYRLRPSAGQKSWRPSPRVAAAAAFLRREFRGALLGERNVDQWRDQGRRIRPDVEAYQGVACSLKSASRLSAGRSWRQTATRPHSARGCRGAFCNSCDDVPFNPSVRRLARKPGVEFFNQPGLSEPRAPRRSARTAPRPPGRGPSDGSSAPMSSSRPTKDVSASRAAASAAAAGANDSIKRQGLGDAPQLVRALLLDDEESRLPGAARFLLIRTDPGSAAAWTRAATFGASPNTSPAGVDDGLPRTQGRSARTAPARRLRRSWH